MEKTPTKNSPNTAEIVDMLRAISSDLHTESHKLQQYERDLLQVQTELDGISQKIWLAYSTMNHVNKVIEELQSILESHPIAQATSTPPPTSVPGIYPVEYVDSDGDGIRIMMEPAEETGHVCWVVHNSRHVNPCHEFPTPEAAYSSHRATKLASGPPIAACSYW
jgi:hypothetical protein